MLFTEAQKQQFVTQGYLAVPNFWTPREVAAMRAELDRLKSEGMLRNVATEGDGKTTSQIKANLQLCPMYPHSTFFRAMPFAPKVAEAVQSLIGNPILLHLDQVFLKACQARRGEPTGIKIMRIFKSPIRSTEPRFGRRFTMRPLPTEHCA